MEKKFLSEMGLARLISHIKAAIGGKADASALSEKADKSYVDEAIQSAILEAWEASY